MTGRIVATLLGQIEGEETLSYAVFRGIPYAKPPVGDLRFRAPQPVEPWKGVRPAKVFSARSFQNPKSVGFYQKEFYSNPDFLPAVSEDSLYLNIWTPLKKSADEAGYPVAFWIHGGGFMGGFGSELEFDGAEFVRRGVILVTVNYRLGPLGFLAVPELAQEDPHQSTGNYGILDQIAALSWVRDNIASFGGNPDNITIFGQSAGAMSVQTIVNSPLAKGMFARAILQSGGGYNNGLGTALSLDAACARGRLMMKLLRAKTADDLRRADPNAFLKRMLPLVLQAKGLPFAPVIDGWVLTESTDESLRRGRIADVPYLLGSNSEDIGVKKGTTGRDGGRLYRGCIDWAALREARSDKPCYLYYFRRRMPGDKAGAFHSAELWYVFGTLARCWRPAEDWDFEISNWMLNAWTNFMKYGDPNGAPGSTDPQAADAWRPYRSTDPYIQDIG